MLRSVELQFTADLAGSTESIVASNQQMCTSQVQISKSMHLTSSPFLVVANHSW